MNLLITLYALIHQTWRCFAPQALIGFVEDVILDFESGGVASLLLVKIEELSRGENVAARVAKNSVKFERVKNISQSIIVSEK